MRFKADATLFIMSIFWGTAFVGQRVAGQMGAVYAFNSESSRPGLNRCPFQ